MVEVDHISIINLESYLFTNEDEVQVTIVSVT